MALDPVFGVFLFKMSVNPVSKVPKVPNIGCFSIYILTHYVLITLVKRKQDFKL